MSVANASGGCSRGYDEVEITVIKGRYVYIAMDVLCDSTMQCLQSACLVVN